MTDELFQAYKAKASELLKAKVPFGEHQRRAFEIIVEAEIARLKGEITELTKHVQLGAEHKKDPIWLSLRPRWPIRDTAMDMTRRWRNRINYWIGCTSAVPN